MRILICIVGKYLFIHIFLYDFFLKSTPKDSETQWRNERMVTEGGGRPCLGPRRVRVPAQRMENRVFEEDSGAPGPFGFPEMLYLEEEP